MAKRINVLLLIDTLALGGTERMLANLVRTIDRERFEIFVVSIKIKDGNPLRHELVELGAPLYVAGIRRIYDPRMFTRVAQFVKRHNIDLIHTLLIDADIVGRVVGRLLRRPVLSSLQTTPQGYWQERFFRRWPARLTARLLATHLTAVSERVRQMFVDEWSVPERQISTIYNAVPIDELLPISPTRTTLGSDGVVIVTAGRLSSEKAHSDLLRAARLVLQQRSDARFIVAGDGPMGGQLRQLAAELGIAGQVHFPGVRHDIPALLRESDIFVLSSLREGLPLSALEAMAAARPAVLTDVGGNRELVEPGVCGYIVPPRDPAAMASALLRLIEDPQLRTAMGIAARERVTRDFDIWRVTAQYEALYTRLARVRARR